MERNLMVAGFGGQGVMTLGKFLAEATCDSTDMNVTFFPSYGAEQRGGTAMWSSPTRTSARLWVTAWTISSS